MTPAELKEIKAKISKYIDGRRLRDAILLIKDTAHKVMAWEVEDAVKLTEQNYEFMLRYLTQGVDDPDRADVYTGLVVDLYGLLDSLVRYVETIDNPSLYYSNIRYNNMNTGADSLDRLIARYKEAASKVSMMAFAADAPDTESTRLLKQAETLQTEIFRRIWVANTLSTDQAATISALFSDEVVSAAFKQQMVSALFLGLMQQYDRRKLELLMDVYMGSTDVKVSSAALVGMLFGLWRYSSRPLSRRLSDRLKAVKEMPSWSSDLQIAFIEMIRARDTERINKKMMDEVIPSMEKLRPDMMDKINDGSIDFEDPTSLAENPEWQDLLDKSGVTEQLKELTEIQIEGGDVMMSTFAHLKNFQFFYEIANWFLPFDTSHSMVAELAREFDVVGDLLDNSGFLCDSDKYSFMLALTSVPQAQRDMMISQFKAQRDNIYMAMSQNLGNDTQPEQRRRAVNSYMQNIYRFFKLFSRRTEFFDPFDAGVNLISVPALAEDFDDTEMLRVVAEFYFKLRYMEDALDVFKRLDQLDPSDAPRYQKMGYCHEHLHQYEKAVECYQYADLLDSCSAWTVRRMASCYRALGDKARALEYYKRLARLQPDDLKSAMLYGQALAENGKYDEAIKEFYKVEFLDEKSRSVWRPLAWTLFLTGNLEGAQQYYQKIILDSPTATDYLNMGHVALAMRNYREAVNNYALSIQAQHADKEWFLSALAEDTPSLRQVGVDTSIVPMIVDAALYSIRE